ncbi:MAG: TIR domain-containing protein [Nitrospira sp.]|nr:TIR domain-containing protein [Nitrospira sp.]
MPEICIIYLSEDESLVEQLVSLLRKHWDVWWAKDIAHGNWEWVVRENILKTSAVISVLSQHAEANRIEIMRDEMHLAKRHNKPIFPFLIKEGTDAPFGFGGLSDTKAYGWTGDEDHPGYQELKEKIGKAIGKGRHPHASAGRAQEVTIGRKVLKLPAFVFSLSSHETQVSPKEGASLLQYLEPGAALVSAYDAWKFYPRDNGFKTSISQIRGAGSVLFLDSGNYEAYRKGDRYAPRANPKGWHKDFFRDTALRVRPDLAFSFDTINPKGRPDEVASRVVACFKEDDRALQGRDFALCPIIHLPQELAGARASYASRIVAGVARELDPLMLAIPERELGDGLLERARTVRDIRRALNELKRYYPLHLLGTGNPLSMIALAAAGADSFDGLEWCRTVADYDRGYLFHFQQFEFFSQMYLHRVQDRRVRDLIEDPCTRYSLKVLGFNVDFFKDWTRSMQEMIHSRQIEHLLKNIPNIGPQLFKELTS